MTTLAEGKAWLLARVDDGAHCPLCTQFAKVYRRKIHATMARDLIVASRTHGSEWFHLPTHLGNRHPGDFAKLAYWGLIVEMPAVRDDGSTRAGWWQVTGDGQRFVARQIRVAKFARIYDGRCLGLDTSETVSIVDALGDRFNYDELMQS